MSNRTVTDWTNYLRETVTADLLFNDDGQIGGPGIIVEIDESKFGKRKYHVSESIIYPSASPKDELRSSAHSYANPLAHSYANGTTPAP